MRFELRIAGEVSVEEGTHKSAKSERWLIAKSENSLPLPSTCFIRRCCNPVILSSATPIPPCAKVARKVNRRDKKRNQSETSEQRSGKRGSSPRKYQSTTGSVPKSSV